MIAPRDEKELQTATKLPTLGTFWDYHFDEYDWNEKDVITAAIAL